MDLEKINPIAYKMWKSIHDHDKKFEEYRCTKEHILQLEALVGKKVPQEYKDYMLKYYILHPIPSVKAYYFKCEYKNEKLIDYSLEFLPPIKYTIMAIKILQDEENAPVIPNDLMPLTIGEENTFLIDLRDKTYGYIWYLPEIKNQRFGEIGNTWDEIGFVAKSLTEFIASINTEEVLIEKYGLPSRS